LLDASGLPFATMFMGESVLDEQHPSYIGMYDGALLEEEVCALVDSADCVLDVGAPMTDFNSGVFTARLDPGKTIMIGHHATQVGGKTHANVEMGDLLSELARRLARRDWARRKPSSLGPVTGAGDTAIDAATRRRSIRGGRISLPRATY
jgi:indolepyruvate decarboxylase